MSTQCDARLADSVRFWTDVKAQALAGGYQWIARMVEALEPPREKPAGIGSTVQS